jgi:hypothetical protein
LGALARFEAAADAAADGDALALEAVNGLPDYRPAPVALTTDAGSAVVVTEPVDRRSPADVAAAEDLALRGMQKADRAIRTGPADEGCNCHGWVFTGGRYAVSNKDVDRILIDNGYGAVSNPRPGDLCIYRQGKEAIHTTVVRATGNAGFVMVEGKWGWLGVYLHAPPDCSYGTDYTFYRSPRAGHLLAGLESPPAESPVQSSE